jgi:L,D-peptidoglycan transpeptidase YkuD (ErfK/YbiS/YcfS/YnhG family)
MNKVQNIEEGIAEGLSENSAAVIQVLNRLPSQQALVVIGKSGFKADLYLYEYKARVREKEEKWHHVGQMPANVGCNGMGKSKEGDGKSPCGIFSLGIAFGLVPQPDGVKYPYALLTPQDYWVDDSQSSVYNKWIHYREGDRKDWQSAEWLWKETICYRHALVINYNSDREPGKGSAIFLHVWKNEEMPTQGCTAVSEANMVRLLQWLDPHQAPVIIQGLPEDILAIAKE